jgi:hypothetical protein
MGSTVELGDEDDKGFKEVEVAIGVIGAMVVFDLRQLAVVVGLGFSSAIVVTSGAGVIRGLLSSWKNCLKARRLESI